MPERTAFFSFLGNEPNLGYLEDLSKEYIRWALDILESECRKNGATQITRRVCENQSAYIPEHIRPHSKAEYAGQELVISVRMCNRKLYANPAALVTCVPWLEVIGNKDQGEYVRFILGIGLYNEKGFSHEMWNLLAYESNKTRKIKGYAISDLQQALREQTYRALHLEAESPDYVCC